MDPLRAPRLNGRGGRAPYHCPEGDNLKAAYQRKDFEGRKFMYRELLIGCGARRNKDIPVTNCREWQNLTTLDINPDHNPDVVWDLNDIPLPFEDNVFDEIHAYEVLEHCGRQGDYKFFFAQFSDFWRIMKPGAVFAATVPLWNTRWAWGDPSHARVITRETLLALSQAQYKLHVGRDQMTDYRYIYKADFDILKADEMGALVFVLRAVKL